MEDDLIESSLKWLEERFFSVYYSDGEYSKLHVHLNQDMDHPDNISAIFLTDKEALLLYGIIGKYKEQMEHNRRVFLGRMNPIDGITVQDSSNDAGNCRSIC